MEAVVPHIDLKFFGEVAAIIIAYGREDLPVLNPGVVYWVDKTTVTWFKFNHDLSVAIAEIPEHNWHHEWPTYRLIPADVKRRWFILLARKYTWDPMQTSTVWTQFNLVARTIFRDQIRKFLSDVLGIIIADGQEDLPVLNPGVGYWVDKTTVTWFKFNHDLSVAIAEILKQNWHHEWPTYRLIPADVKERWFFLLARKYMWDPTQTFTVWTHFNLVARTIFRDQMRAFMWIWARSGDKPEWMNLIVWDNLCDMFTEFAILFRG
ncbi:hypothetical protein ISN45_Aa04g008520 [Arabidopsis thaliana x Arabidopsis arenosa]|uniref:Uncharacterized protein n=1 Tax=Arabidopsis thaliana x Arabidopsis arenosa TaxID=1240361 RepID=A0A8T2A7V7_9BRAS|nr:hypothetical protein ISN45_Aa04g008520 [Arabidopsis thaliana x Arabidopsis arenosa]